MKFEELLKTQGLSDEQISSITKSMSKEKIYTTTLENADERYNKLKGQKEDLEGQIKTSNDTIKDLKKNNADNEELQKTIKQHEDTIKSQKAEYESTVRNITLDNAISKLLADNKAKYADLLASKFNRDKLELKEDGSISGLDDQFKGIKESYKDMFEQPISGRSPNNSNNTNPTNVDINNMTYSQMVECLANNPDAQI